MNGIDRALQKIQEIKNVLDLDFENFQSFDSLYRNFELGSTTVIGTSSCKMSVKEKNHIRFEVEILPGEENAYPLHWHDCLEVCTVREGIMGDLLKGYTVSQGQSITYRQLERHRPYNPGKTTLKITVDFYRNEQ